MYTDKWVRRMFKNKLEAEIEDMVENGNIDPDTAGDYYVEKMQEWEDGYGDYLYDMMGDR